MPSFTKSHFKIATLTCYLAGASLGHAFEQSSYFIFDIVDSAKAKPIEGRLAIQADTVAKIETEMKSSSQIKAERGEFEIDFNQPIQASGNKAATFSFDQPIETPTEVEKHSFGTQKFDLGGSNTMFGE